MHNEAHGPARRRGKRSRAAGSAARWSVFAVVAPPGSANVPLTIGSISFALTVIGAFAAWSAKETHRTPLDELGKPHAIPVERPEFERIRAGAA